MPYIYKPNLNKLYVIVRGFFCIVLTKILVQRHVFVRKDGFFLLKIYLVSIYIHVCICVCVICTSVCRSPRRTEKNVRSSRMADTAAWESPDIGARNLT